MAFSNGGACFSNGGGDMTFLNEGTVAFLMWGSSLFWCEDRRFFEWAIVAFLNEKIVAFWIRKSSLFWMKINWLNRSFYCSNCFHSSKNACRIDSTSLYKKTRHSIMLSSIKISCLWMSTCFVFCDRAIHLIWIWSNRADSEWKESSLAKMLHETESQSSRHELNVESSNWNRSEFSIELNVYLVTFNKSSS
jgi:hypothetical protein